jgi:hypothetical protein
VEIPVDNRKKISESVGISGLVKVFHRHAQAIKMNPCGK